MRAAVLLFTLLATFGTLALSGLLDAWTALATTAGLSGASGMCWATDCMKRKNRR